LRSVLQKAKENHFLLMVLCCTIPLIGVFALSSMGVLGSWGYYALLLLCPIGHLVMMRGMHSDRGEPKVANRIDNIDQL